MKLQEVFINNLKFYRKQKKLTQNELTLAINKSYNYINGIEQGKSFPALDVIEDICRVLEIRPSQLFEENGSPENVKTFSKDEYIKSMTEQLFSRLKDVMIKEIKDTLR